MKIGFIGTGKMAEALIKAIIKAEIAKPEEVIGSDKYKEQLEFMKSETGMNTTNDNDEVVKNSDVVFLCVKPQDMKSALESLGNDAGNKDILYVSIAAGIRLGFLESMLEGKRVIRVMPNTPCLVGEMAAGFSLGKNATMKDDALVSRILNSAGVAFNVKEELLDAVTGLSGSGPAFFAYLINAIKEEGVAQGLSEEIALKLACQTARGTGKLLMEQNITPEKLIEMVSSPSGTTVAGREVLENSDVAKVLRNTVKAATEKSRELGK